MKSHPETTVTEPSRGYEEVRGQRLPSSPVTEGVNKFKTGQRAVSTFTTAGVDYNTAQVTGHSAIFSSAFNHTQNQSQFNQQETNLSGSGTNTQFQNMKTKPVWDYKFYLNVHFLTKKLSGISGVWDRFLTIWAWDSCAFCLYDNGKINESDYWEIQPLFCKWLSGPDVDSFRLIGLVSMHLIMLMRL